MYSEFFLFFFFNVSWNLLKKEFMTLYSQCEKYGFIWLHNIRIARGLGKESHHVEISRSFFLIVIKERNWHLELMKSLTSWIWKRRPDVAQRAVCTFHCVVTLTCNYLSRSISWYILVCTYYVPGIQRLYE